MALANYTDLQSAVTSWLDRNDSDIPITDCIALAEAELNSRVRVRQNMVTTSLSLATGASTVVLPAGFLEEIELNYATGDSLSRGSYNDVDALVVAGTIGRPTQYAIAGTTIQFNSTSDGTYALTLRYYASWNLAGDQTNWLLTTHPDAYLFGALSEANGWLGDLQQVQFCNAKRDAAVQRILMSDSRNKGSALRVDNALVGGGRYNIETD